MPEQHGDKSQEPTLHRRQQAREQGQVARSQDLGSAALLLAALLALMWLGSPLVAGLQGVVEQHLGSAWLSADVGFVSAQFNSTLGLLAQTLLPILAVTLLAAVASGVLQVGILFLPQKLVPDLSRIDPLKGLARLASLASVVRLGFGIVKVILVSVVACAGLNAQRDAILSLAGLEIPQLALFLTEAMLWISLKIALALLVLALLDYGFQRWRHEQDLRMTTQEVREEMKNLQGDPQMVARRRAVQRQLVLNRLATAVPKADVVVTNPTELAIAIAYEPETMTAPIVVAKGAGVLAQRIRRLALEHGIPIVEKKPLAQALYKEVEVGQPIGHQMYSAVAEVLAYVYQLKAKTVKL